MLKLRLVTLLPAVLALTVSGPPALAESVVGTLTLDGLSYVSFGDREILPLASGSTIRFRFGTPASDGSIPFTIQPEDVSIDPIPLSGGGTLHYGLAKSATGTMRMTETGRQVTFHADVTATLARDGEGGTFTYSVPFTTEGASAMNIAKTETVSVTGMRLVDEAGYVQLVGATVNRTNAYPKPGTAVYTVLSGQFDQIP